MRNLKLAKELTELYIKWHRSKYAVTCIDNIREALVDAQTELTAEQMKLYTKWHKKKWPNLDW